LQRFRIGIMEGDGIGKEIVPVVRRVLETLQKVYTNLNIDLIECEIGMDAYEKYGNTIPAHVIETLQECQGWVLGPVSTHLYSQEMKNPSGFFRKNFELFANVRPGITYKKSPVTNKEVNMVIVRENTEGFYSDRAVYEGSGEFKIDPDTAISLRVITRGSSLRVAEYAFALAQKRNKQKKVTAIHKANVLKKTCGLFLEACQEVSKKYPDITLETMHADAAAMKMVMNPDQFDVVLCTNLFGDILSDEMAGIIGGLGLSPGLNVGKDYGMAQATHGSAPDIVGKGIANPWALIVSTALLLEWIGMKYRCDHLVFCSDHILQASKKILNETESITPDIGGTGTTQRMGNRLVELLKNEISHSIR
jgi:3-isopropylmalate dehydrogenase